MRRIYIFFFKKKSQLFFFNAGNLIYTPFPQFQNTRHKSAHFLFLVPYSSHLRSTLKGKKDVVLSKLSFGGVPYLCFLCVFAIN